MGLLHASTDSPWGCPPVQGTSLASLQHLGASSKHVGKRRSEQHHRAAKLAQLEAIARELEALSITEVMERLRSVFEAYCSKKRCVACGRCAVVGCSGLGSGLGMANAHMGTCLAVLITALCCALCASQLCRVNISWQELLGYNPKQAFADNRMFMTLCNAHP